VQKMKNDPVLIQDVTVFKWVWVSGENVKINTPAAYEGKTGSGGTTVFNACVEVTA